MLIDCEISDYNENFRFILNTDHVIGISFLNHQILITTMKEDIIFNFKEYELAEKLYNGFIHVFNFKTVFYYEPRFHIRPIGGNENAN